MLAGIRGVIGTSRAADGWILPLISCPETDG